MSGPLSGVKVLDFTRLLPGPFGTMILADLGAEVVRVESAGAPDLLTYLPPVDGEVSTAHRQMNRSKKSLVINLKKDEGKNIIKRLVRSFDVVIEQFRPGVMDRLGVGYDQLKEENPWVIFCSITGYGQDGPYRDRAGHDINYLALSGIMSYTGRKETGPVLSGIQIADQCAGGMNAVIALLAALYHRERTGQGQRIDISMTDGAVHLGALMASAALFTGEDPGREGFMLNGGGYYDFYETSDGGYVSVGGLEPPFFKAMCGALGRDDLAGYQGASGDKATYLKDELTKEFKKKTRKEWEEIFSEVDACVEPVLSVSEMADHPQTKARKMVAEVESDKGASRQVASPYKFERTPCEYRFAGVKPGSHTREVLTEAGFDEDEIQELMSSEVIK
ncbi:MAG: CaiB/BaiF CoA-transferase family protein [bacterium]